MKRILKIKTAEPQASRCWTTFNASHRAWFEKPLNRRRFIQNLSALSAGLLVPSLAPGATVAANASKTPSETWLTLAAVQQHLFPSEKNAPGAREINALAYLQAIVEHSEFDKEERAFILNGPNWLNELAQKQYQLLFRQLEFEPAEKLLRQIAQSRAGENWLSTLLLYIFESLLCSPVYGGNPDGIGWAWLQHDAGFPQPGTQQSWMKLKKK